MSVITNQTSPVSAAVATDDLPVELNEETARLLDELSGINVPRCFGSFAQAMFNRTQMTNQCNACANTLGCYQSFAAMEERAARWDCFGDGVTHSGRVPAGECRICGLFNHCGSLNEKKSSVKRAATANVFELVAHRKGVQDAINEHDAGPIAARASSSLSEGIGATHPSTLGCAYSFPIGDPECIDLIALFDTLATNELMETLHSLQTEFDTGMSYTYLRNRACAAHIVLNKKGEIAPAFRHWIKGKFVGKSAGSAEDTLASRDRQIVDLDWIGRHETRDPDHAARKIFDAYPVDYRAAADFACLSHLTENKLVGLGLQYVAQWRLSYYRDKAQHDFARNLSKKRGTIMSRLQKARQRPSCRRTETIRELLDVHTALSMCSGSLADAAHVLAGMGCRATSESRLRRLVSWFRDAGVPVQ